MKKRLQEKLEGIPNEKVESVVTAYNKAFHSKIFTLFASSESEIFTYSLIEDVHYDYCLAFLENDEGQWYLGKDQVLKVRKWVIEQARKNPEKIFELYKKWEKYWEEFIEITRKIDLENLSDKELYDLFEKFHLNYVYAGSIAYVCDSFMATGSEDWLETLILEELNNLCVKEKVQYLRTLTSPVHLSFTLDAEYKLLLITKKIMLKFGRIPSYKEFKETELFSELEEYQKNFHWVQNNYYNVHYITTEEFYEQIISMGESVDKLVKEKEEHLEQIRKEREEIIEKLSLSDFIKNLLEIARLFSKWKDVRKSGVYIGMYYYDLFLEEVAKRTSYTKEDLTFTVFDEIEDILLNKKDMKDEIKKRKDKCFYVLSTEGYFIVSGKDADKYFAYLKNQDNQNVIELRGVVASPGYSRGRVNIIRKTHEMKDFKSGEILVTNQTTPEFVPIMKKAAAIITEQGGITSHAAIVSRELGVPCVIGVKNVCSILMQQEVVEVDANNGIIRRER